MAGKPTPRRAPASPPPSAPSRGPRAARTTPPSLATRATRTGRYWLLKSEPSSFSIDDLARAPEQTTFWSGVRNYQARNLLRDELAVGDGVIFYHSNAKPPAAVGLAEVVRAGYPDPTQFEAASEYFDPAATPQAPRWYVVDVRLQERFVRDVSLDELRTTPALHDMVLLRRGSRLSVQPVSPGEWKAIAALGRRRA